MPTRGKTGKHKSWYKKWLKSEKGRSYRNKYRKENYRKRDWGDGSKKRYTEDEIELLLDCELTDTELAFKLKRSVQSIQVKRCKIRKEKLAETERKLNL